MNHTNWLDQQLSARRWLLAPHGAQTVLLPDSPVWQQAIDRLRQYLDYLPLSEDMKQDWIIRVLERASVVGEIEPEAVMSAVWESLRAEMAEELPTQMPMEADTSWRLQVWLAQGAPMDTNLQIGASGILVVQAPETPGYMPVQMLIFSPFARVGSWVSALLTRLRGFGLSRVTQP